MSNNLFVHRLEDRIGASAYINNNEDNVGQLWLRVVGGHNEFDDKSGQISTNGNHYMVHAGIGLLNLGKNNEFNLGLMGAYGSANSDSKSQLIGSTSSSKIDGYGVGLYATWFENPMDKIGAYVDVWAMWNEFNNEVSSPDFATQKYNSSGLVASIEAGSNYKLGQLNSGVSYWIQPQAQFIYQDVKIDSFNAKDTGSTLVESGDANIQTRLGLKGYMQVPTNIGSITNYRPYFALNWIHNTSDQLVKLDNTNFGIAGASNIAEMKLGLEGNVSKNSQAWINISYQQGTHEYNDLIGTIGWKVNF
jgi:autotransporter family porin